MIDMIKHCYEKKKIASFYYDAADTNAHLTGYIDQFNETELLIAHISEHGYYDGFILKKVEDLYRIDCGGEYEQKIENLYYSKKQTHRVIQKNYRDGKKSILYNIFDYAKNNELVVSLEFEDNCLSGLIDRYDNGLIYLSILNDYGILNGRAVINIDEVLTVSVDTDDEQDLLILHHLMEKRSMEHF